MLDLYAGDNPHNECTLVMFKPAFNMTPESYHDLVHCGEQGLRDLGLKLVRVKAVDFYESSELAKELYQPLKNAGKPYYKNPVLALILSCPVSCQIWAGLDAVARVREWLGLTRIEDAMRTDCFRGTMLKRFGVTGPAGLEVAFNYAHASDSVEAAKREIGLIYPDEIPFLCKP
jgi:nucleoside diphosphate kinase